MTREEAIWRLENCLDCTDCFTCGSHDNALVMAIAALREQEEYESLQNSYEQLQSINDQLYLSNQKMGADLQKLLSEQEERSEGCEYCLYLEPLCRSNGDIIAIETDGKQYVVEGDYWGFDIKFCPMCGRKLEVNGNVGA